jgi:hypothetical protein
VDLLENQELINKALKDIQDKKERTKNNPSSFLTFEELTFLELAEIHKLKKLDLDQKIAFNSLLLY